MKRFTRILSIILIISLFSVLLVGCKEELAADPEMQQMIVLAWIQNFKNNPIQWFDENDSSTWNGERYYGTFEGCGVFFMESSSNMIESKNIAGYTFSHDSGFNIWVFYNGMFVTLEELSDNGYIAASYVEQIHQMHNRYEERIQQLTNK